MMRLCLIAVLLLVGCSLTPNWPEPTGADGQVLVNVRASPREGVSGPVKRNVGTYGRRMKSVESDRRFTRVDYDDLPDIVVVLEGAAGSTSAEFGAPPTDPELSVGRRGFDHDQILLTPACEYSFTIENSRDDELMFYTMGKTGDGFDLLLAPGSHKKVSLRTPGVYDLYVDEDESLYARIVVVGHNSARVVEADEGAFFDGLSPGSYRVRVHALRLPEWERTVNVRAGGRVTLEAELTVNTLPKAGR